MGAVALVMSPEELEAAISRAVEPLRVEVERLRATNGPTLVTLPEAARILGLKLRAVQQRARDGRLQVEPVGGVRMVRLPPGLGGR